MSNAVVHDLVLGDVGESGPVRSRGERRVVHCSHNTHNRQQSLIAIVVRLELLVSALQRVPLEIMDEVGLKVSDETARGRNFCEQKEKSGKAGFNVIFGKEWEGVELNFSAI